MRHQILNKYAAPIVTGLVMIIYSGTSDAAPDCYYEGQGEICATTSDCESNEAATVCVTGQCEIPCEIDDPEDPGSTIPWPNICGFGESCVEGATPLGPVHYCQSSKFTMDLNLLDQCIVTFIEKTQPDFAGEANCSLAWNLNQLLDQDDNNIFDIYDLDKCILSFLEEEPCDTSTETCPDNQVYCETDTVCGRGLFCNQDIHRCERECGFISARSPNEIDTLDRKCMGFLSYCDYDTGRCNRIDKTQLQERTCQVDKDCPNGGYCLMGNCAPKCYRNVDCPGSEWYCSTTNSCLPLPKTSDSTEEFNPKDYSVMFAHKNITLDSINNAYDIPILIMNLENRKQVFDNPSVVFGYRLEAKYERKQDKKCFGDLSELSEVDRDDCLISDKEEFVTIKNPFGTVFGTGDQTIDITLNEGAVARLTPGKYEVVLTAIFNNGNSSSARVQFTKTTLSGDYTGRLSVYVDFFKDENGIQNVLANTNVSMKLQVDTDAPTVEWDELLLANNLFEEKIYDDITSGYPITGILNGNENMVFNATTPILPTTGPVRDNNEIAVKGIYSPHLGRMRIIAVVEVDPDFCNAGDEECDLDDDTQLKAQNPFGRKIRRLLQFIGPFDPVTRLFHGTYRETISGLAPWDVTLDGGFRLTQVSSDDAPIDVGDKLLPDSRAAAVGFSSFDELLTSVNERIDTYCVTSEQLAAKAHFEDRSAFEAYLDGGVNIFQELVSFNDLIQDAYNNLNDTESYLTINEFFEGQIEFCEDNPGTNCVSRGTLQCALGLQQKAILSGWIDLNDIDADEFYTLFCADTANAPPDCLNVSMSEEPTLATLREHNRFYNELVQTSVYQANNAISDAFYVLYKEADGATLDAESAFKYKEAALIEALSLYDTARNEFFSAPATAVLYDWPIGQFAMRGQSWIDYMHTIVDDRMQTVIELIDLKRRVLKNDDGGDLKLAHHLLHMEYLSQVYLITLQKHWQKEQFRYSGSGQEMVEMGDTLLNKVNSTRNPLGLHPNRVYFENSDLSLTNWQNYKNRVDGKIQEVEQYIETAVANMKGALADTDTFENALFHNQNTFEAELLELCGGDETLPASCDISNEERQIEQQCVGEQCLFQYTCEAQNDACTSVAKAWEDATGTAVLQETACRADGGNFKITVGGQERVCSRGQMGAFLQERILLKKQREKVNNGIHDLMRQIARQNTYLEETQSDNQELINYLEEQNTALVSIEAGLVVAEAVYESTKASLESADCLVIVGVASGTNCAGKVGKGIALTAAGVSYYAAKESAEIAISTMARKKEIERERLSADAETRRLEMELDNMVTQVENYILEYESVTQQLFNLDVQIKDLETEVKNVVARNEAVVGNIVDRLLGRESGSVLVRNGMVQNADREFHHLLVELYKMVMAFNHRYNMKNTNQSIINQVYQAVTIQDVKDVIDNIDTIELNYCGANGLDCDWVHNPRVLKFSIRDQLFPSLSDIVDAKTGKVLTKGMQFHNLITSSQFVKRRMAPDGDMTQQIEIPFSVWANDRGEENNTVQQWLLNPDNCNHIIVAKTEGGTAGTIAVNVIGSRMENDFEYDLIRGNTDYIRSCDERDDRDQLVLNTYIAGYAPQHAFGQMDEPPTFYTRMGAQVACQNRHEFDDLSQVHLVDYCFKYFARDRSLAAPDWKLVIPYLDDRMSWILGDGLSDDEKPIIEDIVLYIRNSGRPIIVN